MKDLWKKIIENRGRNHEQKDKGRKINSQKVIVYAPVHTKTHTLSMFDIFNEHRIRNIIIGMKEMRKFLPTVSCVCAKPLQS